MSTMTVTVSTNQLDRDDLLLAARLEDDNDDVLGAVLQGINKFFGDLLIGFRWTAFIHDVGQLDVIPDLPSVWRNQQAHVFSIPLDVQGLDFGSRDEGHLQIV